MKNSKTYSLKTAEISGYNKREQTKASRVLLSKKELQKLAEERDKEF